jgi:hypothetical protein
MHLGILCQHIISVAARSVSHLFAELSQFLQPTFLPHMLISREKTEIMLDSNSNLRA